MGELEEQHAALTSELEKCEHEEKRIKAFYDQLHEELMDNKQKKHAVEIKLSQVQQRISEKNLTQK